MLKFLGHSSFLIELNGKKLLFDPFILGNPLAESIRIEELRPDYILISHGHGDHVGDAIAIAQQSGATVISNYEIMNWFDSKGIKALAMNQGGKLSFDFGIIKMVSAAHSAVLPDGSYGGHPNGFVIWNESLSFYFAGDTALSMEMKLIPMSCPKLDFAILPIGDVFTMDVDDAVLASDFCEVSTVVGAHFDTFPPIKIDHNKALESFSKVNKKLILPEIGAQYNWNTWEKL